MTINVEPPRKVESFWIDVGDHLPDDEITVLIATGPDSDGDREIAMAFRGAGIWYDCVSLKRYPSVEAWMDLPELPKARRR